MKEKEFDNFIKSKVDNLHTLTGIEFEDDAVWKKVNTKIQKNLNGSLYFFISASIITLMAIVCFFLFTPSNAMLDEKETDITVEKKVEEILDPIANRGDIENIKHVIYKKRNTKINSIKKELTPEKSQIVPSKDTLDIIIDTLDQKSSVTSNLNQPLPNKNKLNLVDFDEVTESRAYIHVYRPSKIAGALNMFVLKANGKKIGTITNGEYEFFLLESGLTEFEIKRKKIKINLEAKKSYYLRTELIFLGKTKFERVTESFAKEELGSKK